jgi:hypothetical protein
MTSKNGLLNKSFLEEPIQRIIERGPWANYARCDECGVDAGKACRDDDDCVALEVCDGRRLVVVDAYAKCKTLKPGAQTQRDHVSTRDRGSTPVYVPCEHCGASVRLWGQGIVVGRGWCSAEACYKARKAEAGRKSQALRRARDRDRRRAAELVSGIKATAVHCWWCQAALDFFPRDTARPCCREVDCRRARARERQRDIRSGRVKKTK